MSISLNRYNENLLNQYVANLSNNFNPIQNVKQPRWVLHQGEVLTFAKVRTPCFTSKKIEKIFAHIDRKFHKFDDVHIDSATKERLQGLIDLIRQKVQNYETKHGKVYKFFSKLFFGNIHKISLRLINHIEHIKNSNFYINTPEPNVESQQNSPKELKLSENNDSVPNVESQQNLPKELKLSEDAPKKIQNHSSGDLYDPILLCRVLNFGSYESIRNNEDLKKSREFLKLATNEEYWAQKDLPPLLDEERTKILNYSPIGMMNGICYGASIYVLKILHFSVINSEEQLVNLIKTYENGFPGEATALQNIHYAFGDTLQNNRNRFDNLSRRYDLLLVNTSLKDVTNCVAQIIDEMKQLVHEAKLQRIKELQYMASFCDLKVKGNDRNNQNRSANIHTEEAQQEFNQLPYDYYQLSFHHTNKHSETGTAHSLVYIKKEFGSYLLDPNEGLIKCVTSNPAKEISHFLERNYPGKGIFLQNSFHRFT